MDRQTPGVVPVSYKPRDNIKPHTNAGYETERFEPWSPPHHHDHKDVPLDRVATENFDDNPSLNSAQKHVQSGGLLPWQLFPKPPFSTPQQARHPLLIQNGAAVGSSDWLNPSSNQIQTRGNEELNLEGIVHKSTNPIFSPGMAFPGSDSLTSRQSSELSGRRPVPTPSCIIDDAIKDDTDFQQSYNFKGSFEVHGGERWKERRAKSEMRRMPTTKFQGRLTSCIPAVVVLAVIVAVAIVIYVMSPKPKDHSDDDSPVYFSLATVRLRIQRPFVPDLSNISSPYAVNLTQLLCGLVWRGLESPPAMIVHNCTVLQYRKGSVIAHAAVLLETRQNLTQESFMQAALDGIPRDAPGMPINTTMQGRLYHVPPSSGFEEILENVVPDDYPVTSPDTMTSGVTSSLDMTMPSTSENMTSLATSVVMTSLAPSDNMTSPGTASNMTASDNMTSSPTSGYTTPATSNNMTSEIPSSSPTPPLPISTSSRVSMKSSTATSINVTPSDLVTSPEKSSVTAASSETEDDNLPSSTTSPASITLP